MPERTAHVSQPLTSELARRWKLEVDTADSAVSPTWVPVRGIGEFTDKQDDKMQDDTDYDSDGYGSETKTLINWSNELTLVTKTNATTGVLDAGQAKLKAARRQFGEAGTVHIRWYDRNGVVGDAWEGWASVGWDPQGGSADDLDKVKVTLRGQGAPIAITNPAA